MSQKNPKSKKENATKQPSKRSHLPRKYIISVVSIISTYKSPILQALHQYIPYSSYIKNDIDDPTETLFAKARQELEREDIQCVILKKNNHRGRQRKFMFEQLEPLNESYDIKHIVIDFVGDERGLNTTEFRNLLFTRIMKADRTEVVNPLDLKLSQIEQYVLNFTSEYTSLRLAKQRELFDLVVSLNFKKPSVYHSLMMIVAKLRERYGKDLIMNVTDKDISKFSTNFDQKIKKDQMEIQKEGVISMTGYVYANEHGKQDMLPIRYIIIPVTIDYTGYELFNKILQRVMFGSARKSSIISVEIPRDLKDNLEKDLETNEVVLLNVKNGKTVDRAHLRKVLKSFDEKYRYRAIWLNYVPYMNLSTEESYQEDVERKLYRFYKACIKSYKSTHPHLTPEENNTIAKTVLRSGKEFDQITDGELEDLNHWYLDMTEDNADVDLKKYIGLFVRDMSQVYPKLIPDVSNWFTESYVESVLLKCIQE